MRYRFFMLLFLLLAQPGRSQQIKLVLVADTTDAAITPAGLVNISRIERQFKNISRQTGMPLDLHKQVAAPLRYSHIEALIDELQCSAEDVVFFHYSGHGTNSGHDQWPRFLIQDPSQQARLSSLHEALASKQPRLLISMADCCNISGSATGWAARTPQQPPAAQERNTPVLRQLLRHAAGQLICSSSQQGEYAYYEDDLGGYFTTSFFLTLYQAQQDSSTATWSAIAQTASNMTTQMTRELQKEQHPQYQWSPSGEPVTASLPSFTLTKPLIYETKEGDCLWRIARNYGTSVEKLKKWNNLDDDKIMVGQRLKIFD